MWFCIDSCGDVETFDSPEVAKQAAENCLDDERQNASDGWSEDVTHIMWGRVIGTIEETLRRDRTDEDHFVSANCDEVVDYEVKSDVGVMLIPASMDSELEWILGRPNFWCASVAEVLRQDGIEVARKAEAEQASVIHWLLRLRAEHGDKWQAAMQAEHDRIKEKYESRKAVETASR